MRKRKITSTKVSLVNSLLRTEIVRREELVFLSMKCLLYKLKKTKKSRLIPKVKKMSKINNRSLNNPANL